MCPEVCVYCREHGRSRHRMWLPSRAFRINWTGPLTQPPDTFADRLQESADRILIRGLWDKPNADPS